MTPSVCLSKLPPLPSLSMRRHDVDVILKKKITFIKILKLKADNVEIISHCYYLKGARIILFKIIRVFSSTISCIFFKEINQHILLHYSLSNGIKNLCTYWYLSCTFSIFQSFNQLRFVFFSYRY